MFLVLTYFSYQQQMSSFSSNDPTLPGGVRMQDPWRDEGCESSVKQLYLFLNAFPASGIMTCSTDTI